MYRLQRINELEAVLLESLESRKKAQACLAAGRSMSTCSLSQPQQQRINDSSLQQQQQRQPRKGEKTASLPLARTATLPHSFIPANQEQSTAIITRFHEVGRNKKDSFPVPVDIMTPSLENMLIDKLPELAKEISETRITELYAYLANLETERKSEKTLRREKLVEKLGGIPNLNAEQLYRLEQSQRRRRERANLILDLGKVGLMGPPRRNFSLREKAASMDMRLRSPPIPNPNQQPDEVQSDSTKGNIFSIKDKHITKLNIMHTFSIMML